MNELYSVDGQIYSVSPENKEKFLNEFPGAQLFQEKSGVEVDMKEPDQVIMEQTDFATDMLDPEDKILDDRAKETQAARDLMSSLNIPVMEAPKKQATIEPLSETEFYTGRMSKAELDKKAEQEARQKRIDTGQEQLSAGESILNSLGNAINQLEGVDDRAKYIWYFAGTFDFDTEEGRQRSEENRKKLLEIEGDLRKLDLKTKPTIQFTDLGEREGLLEKGLGGVAAFTNAVTAFGTSALIAGTTAGVGLASEMVSSSVRDYNNNKAKEKGVEIGQLIEEGDAEVFLPATLGAVAYALEKKGISKAQQLINAKTTGAQKFLYSMLNSGRVEGFTEYAQFIIETFNDLLGKRAGTQKERQASITEISKEVIDKMMSKQGLETFLQGFAGGKGVFVGGKAFNAAFESRPPEVNKQIQQDIQQISNLEDIKHKRSLTDYDTETINRIQEGLRARVSNEVQNGNNTYSAMTEQDISSIEKSVNNIQDLGKQVVDIVNSKAFTEQEKETFTKPIRRKINKARNDINKIRSQAEQRYKEGLVAENVEIIKTKADQLGVEIQEFTTKQEFAETTGQDANIDGFIQGNKIFINNQRAAEVGAISVGSHELLHRIINNKLSDADTRVRLATGLIGVLRDEGNLEVVQKRIDDNYRYNEDGSQKELEEYAEEYFTVFSDAIVKGDIKYNDSLGSKILEVINSFINQFTPFRQAKFETGRQAYNFIKDYSKNIQQGRVTEQAVDLAGQQTAEVKKSITQADRTALGNQIKALVPPGTTKQQYDSQVIGNVYNDLVIGDRLNGLIRGQLNKFGVTGDNVFGKPINNFVEDVKQQLFERSLTRFNPETNNDLGGFVVSELQQFRIGDVVNRYRREQAGSLDIQAGETGSIRTPVADEADLDVETAEAPRSELKQGLIVDGEQFVDQKLEDEIEANTIEIVEGVTPEINDKDFKTFVKDAAQQKSFKSIKNKLKNLDKFLEDNINVLFGSKNLPIATLVAMERRTPAANRIFTGEPTRLTTQAQIDKAIDEGDFYVENEKQGPSKYPRKKPTIEEVKKFFFDVGASTKGTRKDGLVNAISFSLFRDIVPGVMNKADIVQEDIAKVSAKLVVDPTIKFSKNSVENAKNVFMEDQSFKKNPTEFAAENKNWTKIIEEFVGKGNAINMRTETGVQRFLKIAEENGFVEKIPKSVWRSLQGTTEAITIKEAGIIKGKIDGFQVDVRDFAGNFPFRNVKEADAWIASVEKKGKKFAEERVYKDMTTKITKSQYNNLEKLLNNKDFVKSQDNSLKGLKQLFLTFESLMKDGNKENVAFVGAMLSSTSSYQGHFMRTAAPARFFAKNTFGKIVQEHTLPASITAKYLFTSAVAGKINQDFSDVSKNYFQGALPEINDNALVGFKPNGKPYNYKENTPEGWKITDNIWARYFNENVASIDPSNIILANGNSIVQEFGIDAKGFATNQNIENSKVKAFNKNQTKYSKSTNNDGLLNDLNNHDKALRNARDLNAPKKGISIFDFDDTLATSKSQVIVNIPEQVQKTTGTGNAVKVINTVYKGVVDLIAKNKKIESINFSSDAAESSRIKLYNTLAGKLKKDLGWNLDLFETTSFGKKESEDFTLTKAKDQKNIKILGSNLNFTEDTVGNFKSSFEINNRTYNVSLDKKGKGDYELNFSLIGEGKGKTFKLTPQQFAKQHSDLELQGAKFDFSEFNKVVDGKPGPLAAKIKKAIDKFGNKDVFVLTARPQASAASIKAFLNGIGVNIPLENITGLEDGTPQAKANWVTGKAAEGYNDFYFTDDVYKNVKAVQDALEVLDVKSKTRLAYSDRVKKLDRDFNDIIEAKTGIAAEKEYSRAKAAVVGANKGRFTFFIPPSAEDFVGLLYNTLSKGKLGDSQMAWYKKNLLDPYASAMAAISRERIALMDDYKALKKQLGVVPKNLRKKIPGEEFTNEQAVRVYIWNKQGMNIPGLSKADLKELTDYIEKNVDLKVFGDQLININKAEGYTEPTSSWLGGTITTDMLRGLGTTKRAKHLQQWQQNVDIIFSEKNLNKLEATNGKAYRTALEGILQRMKTGRNRAFTGDSITGRVTDWLTNSIGTIMFFNTRSALLQTISAVNFVNFSDNNIFKAGKAYSNQKQFWSDFMTLMNSEFLVDRRRGLRINVNEADIANMANQGGARGVVSKLLEFGFLPTQIADSFAIASGGATFYRNRINTYKKQGLSDQQAQEQAFNDFREIAEESQQSSRPDRISQQQAGPLGRIILAFANTPMQYARLIKKAASDLKNRRGDVKTNISKIIYYGVAQNLIFNALQQAVFAIAFGDNEDEEDEKDKYINTANGMLDSLLRGVGIAGAFVSVGKNVIKRVIDESKKDNPKYEKITADFARISPPISSKLSRLGQAGRAFQWEKEEMSEKGFAIDNPALMAGANVISAATNIPIDRLVRKANNINTAVSQDLELWERFALLGGWQDWEIGVDEQKEKRKTKKKRKFGATIEF